MAVQQYFSQHLHRFVWLIAGSLLLLGVSQALWLKKVWNEQHESLKQESNFIFQKTVMRMQDSLVQRALTKNGEAAPSIPRFGMPFFPRRMAPGVMPPRDSLIRIAQTVTTNLDTTKVQENWTSADQVRIIVTTNDSSANIMPRGLGRVLLRINRDTLQAKSSDFVLEIQNDTVVPQELQRTYAQALDSAGLPAHFLLRMSEEPNVVVTTGFATDPMPAGLLNHRFYVAAFQGYDGYLIKKITPSALFSLVLMGLIGLAFYLIFSNLKQQKQLSEQKNEFISNVTHELKTPLTTVGVALEALHDFDLLKNPEKTREYLHISKLELERLNLMVDKVLRLTMFEQDVLTLRPEPLDISVITRQVVDAMSLQARQLGATIRFQANPAAGLWVNGDSMHLSGVLFNLLDNALKYRREAPEIWVSLAPVQREGRSFIRLQVADNGIGIAPEYQTQIFEKFFRVPAGDTHNVKGHGLGLSYVAQVVRRHGGDIHLESKASEGSTFTVEIPAATPPPTA